MPVTVMERAMATGNHRHSDANHTREGCQFSVIIFIVALRLCVGRGCEVVSTLYAIGANCIKCMYLLYMYECVKFARIRTRA
jgi:hypothetical protein